MSGARRLEMIRHHPDLSLACQCALLGISRSSLYYQPTQAKVKDLELMTLMDRQYLKTPFYGSRRMSVWLRREGYLVNRKRVRRLMRVMEIEAIYRRPNTSRPSPENKVYPYLLRGLEVSGVNQVWMADITYIPMARGFLYLVAIMDWYSRYVLAWRLSNTLDADFCVDALEEALRQGKPEIFNTDQGSQFTSEAFTSMLLEHGIRISMDGKGRYMDNIFVERLWRSVKYEEVYLKAYQNVPEARAGIGAYLRFYNHERPHQALGYQTPQEIFEEGQGWRCLHEQGLALPSNLETTSPVMVPTKPAEDSLNLALSLSKQWGPLQIRHHPDLSLACQCALLGTAAIALLPADAGQSKGSGVDDLMDRQYLKTPFYGSRRMSVWLRREGYLVNRKRVRRLMRVMGIEAIYRRPNTSRPSPENKVYPYLLRGLEVSGVNQVWMADITYIPMARGFLYLVAIMDWYSRYVLAWRLSNTLDADFCVDALEEALRQGKPEIFNTDQGSQFTSEVFTSMLLEHGIRISMDGKGRYMDNIFVERLWRSVKYEEVYLKA